jgi:gallate decarboxylase subunit D
MSVRVRSAGCATGVRLRGRPPVAPGTGCALFGVMSPVALVSDCWCVPFAVGTGRHRLWGTALFSHGGLGVNVLGGSVPHIGAVAVGIPRPSLARPGRRSATTSVLALVGHKDDELARSMATELACGLGMTVVVTAGVHLPHARASDIAAVLRNASDAAKAILAHATSTHRRRRRRR